MLCIKNCHKCNLYKNQEPLLQNKISNSDTIFVGLSAIKTDNVDCDEPFSITSRSGKLLRGIAEKSPKNEIYFTNIVKCLPLSNEKIRYPKNKEILACSENFKYEIEVIKPKKIILFGKKVSTHVSKMFKFDFKNSSFDFPVGKYKGIEFMDAYHPSYMLIYKRKYINKYEKNIINFIKDY